jgi:DNA-binding PadR family transcriptional regulator
MPRKSQRSHAVDTEQPPSLPATSYAVLGLLSIAPMSGYEIAQAAEGSIGTFWPISKSQVYGELTRLESLSYVTAEDVAQIGAPDKRVYEITPAGEDRLDEWLADDKVAPSRLRIPFLIKVVLAHRLGTGQLLELLERYRKAAEADVADLELYVAQLDETPKTVYARATALYMLRVAQAAAGWAAEIEHIVPETPVRLDPHRTAPEKAKALFKSVPPRRRS